VDKYQKKKEGEGLELGFNSANGQKCKDFVCGNAVAQRVELELIK